MGRKAICDFSLIKEICEDLRTSKKKFKGKLDLEPENGPPKEGKKIKEVRRLLVSKSNEKKQKAPKAKKRKRSPERFSQNSPKRSIQSSDSSSDSASSSDESCSDDFDSDGRAQEHECIESDGSADDNGETE